MLNLSSIGCSTSPKLITTEFLCSLKQAGVECIEVSGYRDAVCFVDYSHLQRQAEIAGIEVWSVHIPFSRIMDISILVDKIRRENVSYFGELIGRVGQSGIKTVVLHPSSEPISADERPERMETSQDSLFKLAEIAKENDVVIAVENLPRTCLGNCSDDILKLISVHDNLRCCFDTNHLLIQSSGDFLKALKGKIHTLHVSDYDFTDEKHWLPLEGKIDWKKMLKDIVATGYDGPFMFEAGLAEVGAEKTVECYNKLMKLK